MASASPSQPAPSTMREEPLLARKLSQVLPKDRRFRVYHLSTPPTKCEALCSAPPGERDDKTFCESHFLTITIDPQAVNHAPGETETETETDTIPSTTSLQDDASDQIAVLAIEILIYTTAHSSVFFVSKADSTGYLSLLNLPMGTSSPIREVCNTFLSYLVEQRSRKGLQSVVSLFARAQDQYLFPGSIKNKSKHVLDDRRLVKWWCRVLDPLVQAPPPANSGTWGAVHGYLVVPGLDSYECRAFLPRATTSGSGSSSSWSLEDPLHKISHYSREYDWVPPRSLIPRFPDDPKSRFRSELDEESAKSRVMRETGHWSSVKSLEQFWEMMAYRQECSSGRLTGFIWVVLDPKGTGEGGVKNMVPTPAASFSAADQRNETPTTPIKKKADVPNPQHLGTPRKLFPHGNGADGKANSENKSKKQQQQSKKRTLKGLIRTRQPQIKTRRRNYLTDRHKVSCAYYWWPQEGRGQKLVDESGYKRSVELLLHLEFATTELAKTSTMRWVREVGVGDSWGLSVIGERPLPSTLASAGAVAAAAAGTIGGGVNNLTGLVKRKRAVSTHETSQQDVMKTESEPVVNTLNAGLVRKKPKS